MNNGWPIWTGARRETLQILCGALGVAAIPGLGKLGLSETAAKNKQRKRCQKQCKKAAKSCDQFCNELPEGDRNSCKNDCKLGKKVCKKTC